MIKDIFVPEKLGGSYLFGKRILGFDVGRTAVAVTQLYLTGSRVIIEDFFVETIESGTPADYNERAILAIKRCMQHVKRYDVIHTSLASAHAVFKELKLPFLGKEKIRMVLRYEVEPLLPFSLDEAVVDFIVTKQHAQDKSSEILVAAVQHEHIANHLSLFEAAGIDPAVISLDVFDVYSLYQHIPSYAALQDGVALVNIGMHNTFIAYITNQQLRFIRTMPQGISSHATALASILNIEPAQAMEHLLRFGLESNSGKAYAQAAKDIYSTFWEQVSFSLSSFAAQADEQHTTKEILLLGSGAQLKGQAVFAQKATGITSYLFNNKKLLDNPIITLKSDHGIPNGHAVSLGAALPHIEAQHTEDERFNLRRKQFELSTAWDVNKQLFTGCILFVLLISALLGLSFWQTNIMRHEIANSELEIVDTLRMKFKNEVPLDALEAARDMTKEPSERFEDLLDWVDEEVRRKERLWFAFSPQEASLLTYLHEATTQLDRSVIDLQVERLSINLDEKTMTLKGSVPRENVDELAKLEQRINQSEKLKLTTRPETEDFSLKIELVKTREGG